LKRSSLASSTKLRQVSAGFTPHVLGQQMKVPEHAHTRARPGREQGGRCATRGQGEGGRPPPCRCRLAGEEGQA
jgi:hypothetical protein